MALAEGCQHNPCWSSRTGVEPVADREGGTAITNSTRQSRLAELPPGTYTVTFAAPLHARTFSGFTVTDNRALGPEHFDRFTCTVPTDSRLLLPGDVPGAEHERGRPAGAVAD